MLDAWKDYLHQAICLNHLTQDPNELLPTYPSPKSIIGTIPQSNSNLRYLAPILNHYLEKALLELFPNPIITYARPGALRLQNFIPLCMRIYQRVICNVKKWSQYECGNTMLRALKLRTLSRFKSKLMGFTCIAPWIQRIVPRNRLLIFNPKIKNNLSIKEFLILNKCGKEFCNYYLYPMASAIWSTPELKILDF